MEKSIKRKLTCDDVKDIITLFLARKETVVTLAEKYGVSRLTITRILYRWIYRDCYVEVDLNEIDEIMQDNLRLSKGRGRKGRAK